MRTSHSIHSVDIALLDQHSDNSKSQRLNIEGLVAKKPEHLDYMRLPKKVNDFLFDWDRLDSRIAKQAESLRNNPHITEPDAVEVRRLGNSRHHVGWIKDPSSRPPSWDDFSPHEQDLILKEDPDFLLTLNGVPADVRKQAWEDYYQEVEGDIAVIGLEVNVEIEVDVAWVEISVSLEGRTTVYSDGRCVLELEVSGEVGAELGDLVEAGVEAGYLLVYEFSSPAEMAAFLAKLQGMAIMPGAAALFLHNSDNLTSQIATVGLYVEIDIEVPGVPDLGAEFGIGGGVGRDFKTDEWIFYVDAQLELEMGSGTFDGEFHGRYYKGPEGDRLTLDAHLAGGMDLYHFFEVPQGVADGGIGVEVSVDLDLRDPLVAHAWDRFRKGDLEFTGLLKYASVTGNVYASLSKEFEVDAGVVDVEVEIKHKTYVGSFHKASRSSAFRWVPMLSSGSAEG